MFKVIKKDKPYEMLYVCGKNDTIDSIKQKFNLTSEEIQYYNPLFSGVYEGCVLWLVGINKRMVVVKPLQTLYDIARENNVTVDSIIKINHLKSDKVFVGMHLRLE